MARIHLPLRSCFKQDLYPSVNFPDFMTRASREFIDSAVFFDFLGGMAVMTMESGGGDEFGRNVWMGNV